MTAAAIATIATVETARTTERVLASLFGLKPATVIFGRQGIPPWDGPACWDVTRGSALAGRISTAGCRNSGGRASAFDGESCSR